MDVKTLDPDELKKTQNRIKLAGEISVNLTPVGATFPYKKDPRDRNIRIAPTFPPIEDLQPAMNVLAICTQPVSVDKLMAEK